MSTHSMTGFGRSESIIKKRKFTFEVKSLNSKQLDVNIKLPGLVREIEMPLRTLISKTLNRGKVEFTGYYQSLEPEQNAHINSDLMAAYADELEPLTKKIPGIEHSDWLNALLKLPDVLQNQRQIISDEEKSNLMKLAQLTIESLIEFREKEGRSAEKDLRKNILIIGEKLELVKKLAPGRIQRIRERIALAINEIKDKTKLNQDRFEQELIFYIEKLDINEEIIRLGNHLDYFDETLNLDGVKGKKLAFISQEIGREINTIGSKSNDAQMQKEVVMMKDSLEKIKEQLLNIV